MLHGLLLRSRNFRGRSEVGAKGGDELGPHPRSGHIDHAEGAQHEPLLDRHGLPRPHITRGFSRNFIHRDTPRATRIAGQAPRPEHAYGPKPLIEPAGRNSVRSAQGAKTKTAARIVKCAAALESHNARTRYFERTRGNSARSQSSISPFSCRTESSRNAIVIFIRKARSRSSRRPSLTTWPSPSRSWKVSTRRGG